MTEHKHHLTVTDTQPAPDGLNGRTITIACNTCDHTHQTITLRTDTEIQTELNAYNEDGAA